MILHTLNRAPDSAAFRDCLRFLTADDALLLLGDGIYAALKDSSSSEELAVTGASLYVLEADASAAGIVNLLGNDLTLVDFAKFVELTEHFPRQQAWH